MCSQLNSVLLEGNLVKAPELKKLESGKTVTTFPIANHRCYRNTKGELVEDTTFMDVKCWDNLAERCAELLKKGSGVRLVGRIIQETWLDANQKNHSKLVLSAEHVELMAGGRIDDIENEKEEEK